MKILALTPSNPTPPNIWSKTFISAWKAIKAYDGPVDWVVSHNDNPLETGHENVTRQHNKARQMVLDGDYDALLSIEADMVVPEDTIARLIACESDIAYGVYVWRHGDHKWSAYPTLGLFKGRSISEDEDAARAAWGTVIDVGGVGMGCTLIRRNVLEQMEFRLYDGEPSWIDEAYGDVFRQFGIDPREPRPRMFCDDWMLGLEAQHFGFSQRCDLGLVCGHQTYKPWPQIYWPDMDAPGLWRSDPLDVTFTPMQKATFHVGGGVTEVYAMEPGNNGVSD